MSALILMNSVGATGFYLPGGPNDPLPAHFQPSPAPIFRPIQGPVGGGYGSGNAYSAPAYPSYTGYGYMPGAQYTSGYPFTPGYSYPASGYVAGPMPGYPYTAGYPSYASGYGVPYGGYRPAPGYGLLPPGRSLYAPYPGGYPFAPAMQNNSGLGGLFPMLAIAALGMLSGGFGSPGPAPAPAFDNSYCPSCTVRSPVVQPLAQAPPPPPPLPDTATEAGIQAAPVPVSVPASAGVQAAPPAVSPGRDRVAAPDPQLPPPPVLPVRRPPPGLRPPTPDRLTPAELSRLPTRSREEQAARSAPVWPTFIRSFEQCRPRPDCVPWHYHAWGHRPSPRSCHPSGRALDLHSIKCGNQIFEALAERSQPGPFTQMKNCIARRMPTLWHNRQPTTSYAYRRGAYVPVTDWTSGHWDHAHFSIGCGGGI